MRSSAAIRLAERTSRVKLERRVTDLGRVWERNPEYLSRADQIKLAAARYVLQLPPLPGLPPL